MKDSDISPTSATLNSRCRALRVALGKEPADYVLRGGRILNVFSGKWEEREVAVAGELIASTGKELKAADYFNLERTLLVPGFIDAHIHLESTHLWLDEISRLMLEHGVTTVVADPHEMANVRGLEGVMAMIEAAREVALDVCFMVPSCVPASEYESPGAEFDFAQMKLLLREPDVIGVAEMMNYPGVLREDQGIWNKLGLSTHIDGHIQGATEECLQAYVAAGIRTDHESAAAGEAREKIARGMFLFIREGSAARNLQAILPVIDAFTWRRAAFCTDDLSALDLLEQGSIDNSVRKAVEKGISLEQALTMASWNAAQAHGLENLGAIAPGYIADILVLEPDTLTVKAVLKRGKPVVRDGKFKGECRPVRIPRNLLKTVHFPFLAESSLRIPYHKKVRAIGLTDGEILTSVEMASPVNWQGSSEADPRGDLLKAVVVERHGKSGKIGLGFVRGLGLEKGAMASTVAHDAHNLVIVGANDSDMIVAARKLADMGGGQILVSEGKVLASLALPVAGLMTDSRVEDVAKSANQLKQKARELGACLTDPFATLSFLALSVLPKLRLTTKGLLDVEQWKIVDIGGR